MPTEVEVLRMQMSKTEERMRRRDLRKIFVDPNACGVALPTVGFDSETATRGGFSAQDDTKGGHSFKLFDKSKFEGLVERTDKQLHLYLCNQSFCGGVGVAFFKKHPHKRKRPFWVVVPKRQREQLKERAQG